MSSIRDSAKNSYVYLEKNEWDGYFYEHFVLHQNYHIQVTSWSSGGRRQHPSSGTFHPCTSGSPGPGPGRRNRQTLALARNMYASWNKMYIRLGLVNLRSEESCRNSYTRARKKVLDLVGLVTPTLITSFWTLYKRPQRPWRLGLVRFIYSEIGISNPFK